MRLRILKRRTEMRKFDVLKRLIRKQWRTRELKWEFTTNRTQTEAYSMEHATIRFLPEHTQKAAEPELDTHTNSHRHTQWIRTRGHAHPPNTGKRTNSPIQRRRSPLRSSLRAQLNFFSPGCGLSATHCTFFQLNVIVSVRQWRGEGYRGSSWKGIQWKEDEMKWFERFWASKNLKSPIIETVENLIQRLTVKGVCDLKKCLSKAGRGNAIKKKKYRLQRPYITKPPESYSFLHWKKCKYILRSR